MLHEDLVCKIISATSSGFIPPIHINNSGLNLLYIQVDKGYKRWSNNLSLLNCKRNPPYSLLVAEQWQQDTKVRIWVQEGI